MGGIEMIKAASLLCTAMLIALATLSTPVAAEWAVTEFLVRQVSVFGDDKGQTSLGKFDRSTFVLPALKLAPKSSVGLIQVRFVFKDPQAQDIIGWVRG